MTIGIITLPVSFLFEASISHPVSHYIWNYRKRFDVQLLLQLLKPPV
jgi:hypothetical protein